MRRSVVVLPACVAATALAVLVVLCAVPAYAHAASWAKYVGAPYWDEYQHVDSKTTGKSIQLQGYVEAKKTPAGVEIYRKAAGAKKYKKIKTIKRNKLNKWRGFNWTDRKVKCGKAYTYKFRAYRKISGKKRYSKWSWKVKMLAINNVGSYKFESITPYGTTTDTVEFKLTSTKKANGTLVIQRKGGQAQLSYCEYPDDVWAEPAEAGLNLVATSTDGQTWSSSAGKTVKLKVGESLYLRYQTIVLEEGERHPIFTYVSDIDNSIEFDDGTGSVYGPWYNSRLDIRVKDGLASCAPDGECYH